MINQDIRKKIKKIRLHTNRVMQSFLSGDYLSAFKGSGLEFDQIRPYSLGDDIRFIDWNNSAKMNEIMVKQFIQERDRTVILVIDTSLSMDYSSRGELKKDLLGNVASSLAFIAELNKDKVGALFFSDRVEKWIAPGRGKLHVGTILQSIFSMQPKGRQTNLAEALRFLASFKHRNAIVFFISDWIAEIPRTLLTVAAIKYDFIGVRILDHAEQSLPDVGLIDLYDKETGETITVDTSDSKIIPGKINEFLAKRLGEQQKIMEKYRVDMLDFYVEQSFITPLINFFHRRIRRQV